jgi:hypothetical protein
MLTRIYADNYRALVNFELALTPRALLMGRNGTGKSTVGELLMRLQTLLWGTITTDTVFGPETLTRWQKVPRQRIEIDATGDAGNYHYVLIVEHRETVKPDEPKSRIVEESLAVNGKNLFLFADGNIRLFKDDFTKGPEYPGDWGRSALGTIRPHPTNTKLTWFVLYLRNLTIISPNPRQVSALAEREDAALFYQAENFSAWYHWASSSDKRRDHALHQSLSAVLPGFSALNFEPGGPGRWYLRADFEQAGVQLPVYFNELSDGQKSLILLYSVLHYSLERGRTVWFDEPDNFVALDEIQPWLAAATDAVDDHKGQLLIASHHPEIYNQWAAAHGRVFERDGCGPVRVRSFSMPEGLSLTPAEAVARGYTSPEEVSIGSVATQG